MTALVITTRKGLKLPEIDADVKVLSPPFPSWGSDPESGIKLSVFRMPTDHLVAVPVPSRAGSGFKPNKEGIILHASIGWYMPFSKCVKPVSGLNVPSAVLRGILLDYYYVAHEKIPQLNLRIETLKSRIRQLEADLREERRIAMNALEVASSMRSLAAAIASLREGSEQLLNASGDIQVLLLRVEELRSLIGRGFEDLRRELNLLKEEVAEAKRLLERGDVKGAREALESIEERVERVGETLPSWASDNPWLELIARSRRSA
ncbi:MAG: hypothetical protein QXZ31_09220 [Thermofilaceae archaeon]